MKVHLTLLLAMSAGCAAAQDFKADAQRHIRMTVMSVELCQTDLQTIALGLEMHRLNPADPRALTPQMAAKRIPQCGEREARNAQNSLPAQRDEGQCRVALEDFHGAALAHLETIGADPLEPLQRVIRRTGGEALALKQKATKTRLACQ